MSEVELARITDRQKSRKEWTERLGYFFLTLVILGLVGSLHSCLSATKPAAPCHNSAKIVIMHDKDPMQCDPGATMQHEKMDDFKMYVECTCK